MKLIIQAVAGGILVMAVLGALLIMGGGGIPFLLLLWPIFIFRDFFPPPPNSLIPGIPNGTGLLISLLFATFVYSLLIYVLLRLRLRRHPQHSPTGPSNNGMHPTADTQDCM